jgi:hypothetical protein
MDEQLTWGPCDGDVVTVEPTEREIRIPVVCGICLDDLPSNLDKSIYTEALYLRDSEGRWLYSGRMRYRSDGTAFWHEA